MSSLKHQKEQFVSDLVGGSVAEIYAVTLVSLTAFAAYSLIKRYHPEALAFVPDFLFQVASLVLAITLYSGDPRTLHLLVAAPALAVYAYHIVGGGPIHREPAAADPLPKKGFLTAYRAHMLVITNVAILAVDFHVFPRRFAKVETWGTSMMDLGVGLFVFSMGLVSARSLLKGPASSLLLCRWSRLIWRSLFKSLPVLALGLARLASVKSLEYQEHTSEYGIHWNFFVTLGLLPVVLALLEPVLAVVPRVVVAAAVGLTYDQILTKTNLLAFILTSENRLDNLLTMNKEGIFSFLGYLSIFLFGQSFGYFVLPAKPTSLFSRQKSKLAVSTTKGLVIFTLAFHALAWYTQHAIFFTNVSRRLANFPYVIWVVSYNATLLLGYNVVEKVFGASRSPILDAINNNGLAIFLLANLTTGLTNLTINTLAVSNPAAVAILFVHSLVFVGVAVVLDKRKIYIKF